MPKVTVVMPSLNVKPYIRECIESVINQTLEDIQIIIVDSGSTDGTLEIIHEYSRQDSRIEILYSNKKSYGYQVNLGFAAAKGKYVGIVETDDYISEQMYQRLYEEAEQTGAEIVKANFSRFTGDGEERKFSSASISSKLRYYNQMLNPQENPRLLLEAFYTWAGIYKREFIEKNRILHNETPGASYQDNGFYFQTLSCASKMYLIKDNLYRLRRDNPNSSFNNSAKVYCVCDEYDFIHSFLCINPERKQKFASAFWINKFRAYFSTLKRIAFEYKLDFLKRFSDEFNDALLNGEIDLDYFTDTDLCRYRGIVTNYENYFYMNFYKEDLLPIPQNEQEEQQNLQHMYKAAFYQKQYLQRRFNAIKRSPEYRIGCALTFLPQKINGGVLCLEENGLIYTIQRMKEKIDRIVKR